MEDLPYKTEYAKTGRANCKGCKTSIGQGSLRLAAMVQSAFHDGKQANWFHERCFFKKQRPQSEGDIDGFENIRYEDQKKLREKIAELSSSTTVVASTSGKGKGKRKAPSDSAKDFGIEYAKSGRAACRGCELKITKDEIRIKKVVFDTEVGMKYGGQPLWHHVDCFAQVRNDLGWLAAGDQLPGFSSLKKEDKAVVLKAIPAMKAEDIPDEKKPKLEPKTEEDKVDDQKLEKLIEKQSKVFFKFRDNIEKMKKNHLDELLEANDLQAPVGDRAKVYDLAADILTFGALTPCEKCKDGQLMFSKSGYVCTGDLTEWTKCVNFVKEPKRVPCKVPKDLKNEYKFLEKYKSKVENRAVRYTAPSAQALIMTGSVKKEDELDGPKVKKEKPPLYEFQFVIIGLRSKVDSIKSRIQKLGGKVVTKITDKTMAVISTPEEVEKMTNRMKQAQDLGIHVVPEEYITEVEGDSSGAVSFINGKSICDWGTDPTARMPVEDVKSGKSKSIYTKSVPSSMTLKLKGGLAVDPASGLEDITHVFVDGSLKYSSVLGLTDIQNNKNKYYKLQLLESDNKNRYWVFRSWGRIGTTIGGSKVDNFGTLHQAKNFFRSHYEEKSGNDFGTSDFQKRPGLMYPIDVAYDEDKKVDFNVEHDVKSKLPTQVQDIIKLIFDIDAMKKTMMEFQLDMEKMPLGKLSKKQIQSAYKVLTEISELITKGGGNERFIDATNRFYTLIPQNFGVNKPPLLDTTEQIKNLSEMLDALMEIECAYNMLNSEDNKTTNNMNPIDHHYEQLKTKLVPLDHNSEEFKLIATYIDNTHAETHRSYELELLDVFKVERSGESRRYKPFKKLHNRKLLWHGSRLTNFAGILSHGLKIAPPEAPVSGYMFGKGIYFADMVSKSANYCFTSAMNSTGLLLLSEVALGNMYERLGADYITKLPDDKHSTLGVGRTAPDPSQAHVRKDGVEVPLGKPVINNEIKSSLLYNEYIVYDVAQVNIQYLLKVNFNYKY